MKTNPKYITCNYSRNVFRLVQVLIYTPPGFIVDIFYNVIINYAKTYNVFLEMTRFLTYISTTFVGKKYKNGHIKAPLFSV